MITLLILIYIIFYIQKKAAVQAAEKEKNYKILQEKKNIEDQELLKEIKVKCDDGIVRIYSESMFGILREYLGTKEVKIRLQDSDDEQYLKLSNELFFSSKGVLLDKDEILVQSKKYIEKKEEYLSRYGQFHSVIKPNIALGQYSSGFGSLGKPDSAIVINNMLFESRQLNRLRRYTNLTFDFYKELPIRTFSGFVDEIEYQDGVAVS